MLAKRSTALVLLSCLCSIAGCRPPSQSSIDSLNQVLDQQERRREANADRALRLQMLELETARQEAELAKQQLDLLLVMQRQVDEATSELTSATEDLSLQLKTVKRECPSCDRTTLMARVPIFSFIRLSSACERATSALRQFKAVSGLSAEGSASVDSSLAFIQRLQFMAHVQIEKRQSK